MDCPTNNDSQLNNVVVQYAGWDVAVTVHCSVHCAVRHPVCAFAKVSWKIGRMYTFMWNCMKYVTYVWFPI